MHYELQRCSETFSIRDFHENLFFEDDYIEKKKKIILKNIEESKRYQILHSYSKNGKSTLLRLLFYEYHHTPNINGEIKTQIIDFNETRRLLPGLSDEYPLLNDSICHFLNMIFDAGIEKIKSNLETLAGFLDYIDKLRSYCESSSLIYYRKSFLSYFIGFYYQLGALINETLHEWEKTNISHLIIDNCKNRMTEIFVNAKESSSDLFSFILFYHMYLNREIFNRNTDSENRTKLIFVIDNIDDILTNKALDFSTNYVFHICKFFETLKNLKLDSVLREERLNWQGFVFEKDLLTIFVYRTANYLNAISSLAKSRTDREINQFRSAPVISMKTVKNSHKILAKRLDFFNYLSKVFSIEKPQDYRILRKLVNVSEDAPVVEEGMETFDNKKDLKNIFRFWNGNRDALLDLYFSNYDEIRRKYFNTLLNSLLTHPRMRTYLVNGFYVYLFLDLLKMSGQDGITKAIRKIYEYQDNLDEERTNFRRLLITFIVNKCKKKGKTDKTEKIVENGVGLYDLIELFINLKDTGGNRLYKVDEISEFFNDLFFDEIDAWGHIFSCHKSTLSELNNGKKIQGKYYDFEKEFKEFKENSFESKRKLNRIRIFNNDNAEYFIRHIQPHFEYYSYTVGNKKPLTLSISYDEEGVFEFEDVIRKVFDRVKKCVKIMGLYYIHNFSRIWTPNNYIKKSGLVIGKTFYFSSLISKHITYLEQFREALLSNRLGVQLDKRKKISANTFLTNAIDDYITVFNDAYQLIFDHNLEIPGSLEGTKNSFDFLRNHCIAKIKASSPQYSDFRQPILTRN